MTNASTRWSHLVRHGLIGTSLLGAASVPAAADPCDWETSQSFGFVLGLDLSPRLRVIGGVEGRVCLDERSEALVRLELGGGDLRVIAGARVRPFESNAADGDSELVGLEGGLVLDAHQRFGLHGAATYGTHYAYGALQTMVSLNAAVPTRFSLLGGLSPSSLMHEDTAVPGRPLRCDGRYVRPKLAAPRAACASEEQQAVSDYYVDAAQLELSSVWTFLRLAQELAAVGAPATLIARALDAADDEVRHAEMCARAAGGIALEAPPMDAARPRFTERSAQALAVLAAEAWREGCHDEAAAAEEARLAACEAEGAARTMLVTIAADEHRHAELSWSVLAWVRSIDPSLAAVAVPYHEGPSTTRPYFARALARHGVPSPEIAAAARSHARRNAARRIHA